MSGKKLVIEHEVHYVGNGCDCCEPTPLDVYRLNVDGVYVDTNGTPYSEDTALEYFLEHLGYEIEWKEVDD